jgi:copper homeostasis protein CutC
MPGAGIRAENLKEIAKILPAREFHGTRIV